MIPIHPRISVNSLCFGQSPLQDCIRNWRDLGAKRVSLPSTQLLANEEAISSFARESDVVVETVAHIFYFGALERAVMEQARNELFRAIDAAVNVGARSIYLLTGARGGDDWETSAGLFCEAISPCAQRAKAQGIALLIENAPFLFADFHFAHSLRDAMILARASGLGLCIDIFGCWTEAGLSSLLKEAIPFAGIVQLSDFVPGARSLPARAVPGDGAIPIAPIVAELLASGYRGAFDLELLGPRIDEEGHVAAARRAALYVDDLLRRVAGSQ